MFAEAIQSILSDHGGPATVRRIEAGGSPLPLWHALEQAGFLELLTPQEQGGAGLTRSELFPVLAQFGRHAMPVPFAQAIVARAFLPAGAAPAGPLTLAPSLIRRADGSLFCPRVPFGRMSQHVLAAHAQGWLLLDLSKAASVTAELPSTSSASLVWQSEDAIVLAGSEGAADLQSWGAALHAALLAGALARVFEMSLQHGNEREQFGRSLGKFQAVQHQLAVMAEQVAAASLAAQAAFAGDGKAPQWAAAAMAKARTSAAVGPVAASAHALHGAIGITADHDLQLLTRRLHDWRMAHGSESWWHQRIGEAILASQHSVASFVRCA